MAKRGVTKASSSSIAFSALSTTPIPRLPLFSSKRRYKALPKRGRVEINLYSSNKDLPRVNKVIATKVPVTERAQAVIIYSEVDIIKLYI